MRKMCPSRTVREAAGQRAAMTRRRRQSIIVEAVLSGVQEPYVSKELSPQAQGVIVIAPGGDDAVVVKNITGSCAGII